MKRFFAALLSFVLLLPASLPSYAQYEADEEMVKARLKNMIAVVSDVDPQKNWIWVRSNGPAAAAEKAAQKIDASRAVIIQVNSGGAAIVPVAKLQRSTRASFLVEAEVGPQPELRAFLVLQVTQPQKPLIQFGSPTSSGSESIAAANIPVNLSFATTQDVTVKYAATGGKAKNGVDYSLASGDLTIPAGQTMANIPLTVMEDDEMEVGETVVISLSYPKGASFLHDASGWNNYHVFTINDNDHNDPKIQFSAASSSGLESLNDPTLALTISPAATTETKVKYAVTGGTATGGGSDFTLASGELTLAAGQTSATIPFSVVGDSTDEPDETVMVTLSDPTKALLGSTQVHTYTILDDDSSPLPTVEFSAAASSGAESTTSVSIPVTLSAASTQDVKVSYAVSGTATGGGVDYTLADGVLTIPAGQTSGTIQATVVNDTLDELDETLVVTLSSPDQATLGALTVHTYTIQDDDEPTPTVQFSTQSVSAFESSNTANLPVALSVPSSQDVKVKYTVTGGTATGGGIDFMLADGELTIPAGQTTGFIVLSVMNDALDEPDETVMVTLSDPQVATLGAMTLHTYTILDDNAAPTVQFSSEISSSLESVPTVDIAVSLSAASGQDVKVNYAVTGGTAIGGGVDFTLLGSGELTIPAGQTTANLSLTVENDTLDESDETIMMRLSSPQQSTLGSNVVHMHTILDND